MSGARVIFVDGYNVIRNTPALAQAERVGGLEGGQEALLARLIATYRHTSHQVIVVFDGARTRESREALHGFARGLVIFSRAGESADAVIVRLAAEACGRGEEVTVISDDREIRDSVGRHGAATARVGDFQRRMDEPPRLLRKRFAGRGAARPANPAAGKDDDEDEARPRRDKGNPRRAPRKRGRRQWQPPI